MIKIEFPTDTPTKTDLGDAAADIQRGGWGENRGRGRRQGEKKGQQWLKDHKLSEG